VTQHEPEPYTVTVDPDAFEALQTCVRRDFEKEGIGELSFDEMARLLADAVVADAGGQAAGTVYGSGRVKVDEGGGEALRAIRGDAPRAIDQMEIVLNVVRRGFPGRPPRLQETHRFRNNLLWLAYEQFRQVDFAVPHDGTQPEISEYEEAEVSEKFSALVDDLLLNRAEEVVDSPAMGTNKLNMSLNPTEPKHWDVEVSKSITSGAGKITLTYKTYRNGHYDWISHEYRMDSNGVVRRLDETGEERRLNYDRNFRTPGVDSGIIPQIVAMAVLEGLDSGKPFSEEPKAKPIGVQEMDALARFVTQDGML